MQPKNAFSRLPRGLSSPTAARNRFAWSALITHRGSTVLSFLGRVQVMDSSGLTDSNLRSTTAYYRQLTGSLATRATTAARLPPRAPVHGACRSYARPAVFVPGDRPGGDALFPEIIGYRRVRHRLCSAFTAPYNVTGQPAISARLESRAPGRPGPPMLVSGVSRDRDSVASGELPKTAIERLVREYARPALRPGFRRPDG
jgi:hypothetical protein